jgi:hypothetical protein
MGFTSGHPCMFSLDMKQTSENVRKVLDISGLSIKEAAKFIGVPALSLQGVLYGEGALTDELWRILLDIAGRRAFDHEDGE